MSRDLKVYFLIATVESILLYGCESRTLTETQEKSLNNTNTGMLRKALNVHWSNHIPNKQIQGDLPAVTDMITSSRLQLDGHCFQHSELSTQHLVLWEPKHGHRGWGRHGSEQCSRSGFDDGREDDTTCTRGWLRLTKWVSTLIVSMRDSKTETRHQPFIWGLRVLCNPHSYKCPSSRLTVCNPWLL